MTGLKTAFSGQTPTIGGYAIIKHSGNELFDSELLVHLAPTRRKALKFVAVEIGALTPEQGDAKLQRWLAERGEKYNGERDTSHYASLHALSPEMYRAFQARMDADIRAPYKHAAYDLAQELLGSQRPCYEVGAESVYCTEEEREVIYHPVEVEYLDEDEKIAKTPSKPRALNI